MTTLLAISTSDGLVKRCDAKCYEARHSACVCVCGGSNHGKGRADSIKQTRQRAEAWAWQYAQSQGITRFTTMLHAECQQATLWGEL